MLETDKRTAQEFIRDCEAGKIPFASLYAHFGRGDFGPKEILEAYRQRDSPAFILLVQDFTNGKLFRAQTENFDDYLEGKNRAHDKAQASNFYSLEDAAQQKHDGIRKFIEHRIYAALPSKKDKEDLGKMENFRQAWSQSNQNNGWGWR